MQKQGCIKIWDWKMDSSLVCCPVKVRGERSLISFAKISFAKDFVKFQKMLVHQDSLC